jgi:hypothetical protein
MWARCIGNTLGRSEANLKNPRNTIAIAKTELAKKVCGGGAAGSMPFMHLPVLPIGRLTLGGENHL